MFQCLTNLSPILLLVSAVICFLNNRALANDGKFVTPAMPENLPKTWLTYHLAHTGPANAFPGDSNPAFSGTVATTCTTFTGTIPVSYLQMFAVRTWYTRLGIPICWVPKRWHLLWSQRKPRPRRGITP